MSDMAAGRDTVVIVRTLDAPVELIWRMWTEPEDFAAWYGPDGVSVSVLAMDVRVGGARRVGMEMQTPGGARRMWFTGEHLEVVVNRRLVYTESMADEDGNLVVPAGGPGRSAELPGPTEVCVDLESVEGGTRMVLSHVGIPEGSPGAIGWRMALDKLAVRVAAKDR